MSGDDDLLQPQTFEDDAGQEPDDNPQLDPTPAEPEQAAQPEPKEQMVPLAALKAEREASRGMKARLEAVERFLQSQAQQQEAPRFAEQPEAYFRAMAAHLANSEANTTAQISERFAREKFGSDLVDEAFAAAEAAGVLDQFRGKADGWGDLAKWHKSQKALREIGDDPAAFRERLRQEIIAEEAAKRATNPANQPAPSLAGDTNLGSRAAPAWSGPTPLKDILGDSGSSF